MIDVRVFTRRGVEKDQRTLTIERQRIAKLSSDKEEKVKIIEKHLLQKLASIVVGQTATKNVASIKAGSVIKESDLTDITISHLKKLYSKTKN